MQKVKECIDVNGDSIQKGDTVVTLAGHLTARVADLAVDAEVEFVCLRAMHMPFSKGIWHAADQVQRIGVAKR